MNMNDKIESIRQLLEVQGSNGNWDFDAYMCGLYNGIEISLATLEEREPVFRTKPESGWISDGIPKDFVPTVATQDETEND